ncbi:solute carrier family 23 member 2-like [Babylonia areolata]|uniref:solute carrier family 23 member 2-like n=1 Tax=Babylonia areolata TaxID=304850 RepID=UPI003FD3F263
MDTTEGKAEEIPAAGDNPGGSTPKKTPPSQMLYHVNDVPSFHITFVLAVQHVLMTIPGSMSIPFLLADLLCTEDPGPVRARLCAVSLFLCGLATALQCCLGVRLPIIQGGSHTFLPPIFAMLALDRWRCPEGPQEDPDKAWMERMCEIQGNLMLASVTQVLLGCTGLIGFLTRFIGPLTVAPTIALIGISLIKVIVKYSQVHWGVAFLTMGLVVLFSLVLGRHRQPVPLCDVNRGCYVTRFPVLQLFSIIVAMAISWVTCLVLTVSDVIPNNSTSSSFLSRTDTRLHVLHEAPWFSFPYPFQFGMPTVSAAGFLAMLVATVSSIVESVGDYFAAACASEAPPPPPSAINRGVAMEGVASIVSGMLGSGHGTTSFSGNVGAVTVTKVASRRVFQTAGMLLMVGGVVGKVGALFSLIPDPVVGGALAVILSIVSAIGLGVSQHADMTRLRNLTILGLSLILGLMVPRWASEHADLINTGNKEVDQVVMVLLGTPMALGGCVGCVLDNLIPGTLEERGFHTWTRGESPSKDPNSSTLQQTYDIPYVSGYLRKFSACACFPLSPSYEEATPTSGPCGCRFGKGRDSPREDSQPVYSKVADRTGDLEMTLTLT